MITRIKKAASAAEKAALLLILILMMSAALSADSKLSFFFTDNILNSSDKMSDAGVDFNWSYKSSPGAADIYLNAGVYSPLVYYTLFSVPYSVMLQFNPVFNMKRMLFAGAYAYNIAYFGDYYENNLLSPGIFLDYKEYIGSWGIVKPSLDVWYRCFPFEKDMSSAKAEITLKNVINIPFGMSVHLNGFAGYSMSLYDMRKDWKYELTPLISANLFGSLGLSASYRTEGISSGERPYYTDDSFLDRYSYCLEGFTLKATILVNSSSTASVSFSRHEKTFEPLLYIAGTDSVAAGFVETRIDSIDAVNVNLLVKSGENSYNINYRYEKHSSTNNFYNYSSNYFSFGILF